MTKPLNNHAPSLFDQPIDDQTPFVRGSITSYAAAEKIRPARGELHQRILRYLRDHGPATDEAIATGLAMNPSTERPRRIELFTNGLVVEAGFGVTSSGRRAQMWAVAKW